MDDCQHFSTTFPYERPLGRGAGQTGVLVGPERHDGLRVVGEVDGVGCVPGSERSLDFDPTLDEHEPAPATFPRLSEFDQLLDSRVGSGAHQLQRVSTRMEEVVASSIAVFGSTPIPGPA